MFGLHNNSMWQMVLLSSFYTSEALIYIAPGPVKLDSCFTLTLVTVKVDVLYTMWV